MPHSLITDLPAPPAGKDGWPWTTETPSANDKMPDGRNWPKVSIITPNYNYADFLETTIRSTLLQGYPNLEYIIIDGGSTDGSLDILHTYDPWIAHWVTEADSGAPEAINKGLRRATGEVVAIVPSDDCLHPEAIKTAIRIMSEISGCDVIHGEVRITDKSGNKTEKPPFREVTKDTLLRYWQSCFTPRAPATFFKRSLLEEVGFFDESLKYAGDTDLWLRMIQNHPFRRVADTFADYCIHPKSKTGGGWENFEPEWRMVVRKYWGRPWSRKYLGLLAEESHFRLGRWLRRLSSNYFDAACVANQQGKRLRCLRMVLAAFIISPGRCLRRSGVGLALRVLVGDARVERLKSRKGEIGHG